MLIIFAGLACLLICLYKDRIKVVAVFLYWAARFIKAKPVVLAYVPLFLLLTAGLIFLCFFQYLAFNSSSSPEEQEGDIYLQLPGNGTLTVLTLIEFIWGLQFLKDACTCGLTQSTSQSQEGLPSGTSRQRAITSSAAVPPSPGCSSATGARSQEAPS